MNRVCKDIMQFSQQLLDALINQEWSAAAIDSQLNQMSSMIEEHHACFDGVWFSGFVRMGQGGPLEMITTCKVRTVSNGGRDSKCLNIAANILFTSLLVAGQYGCPCMCGGHTNKCFEANRSGWRDVISNANDLLTCHDLGRFLALGNNGHKSVEGEYNL
jgi:hypothetical protein